MKITRALRRQLLVQDALFLALLIALVMLLAYAARQFRAEWDVTGASRNSLSPATVDLLKQLAGPIKVTAFAPAQDLNGVNVHRRLEERLCPYQRVKRDFSVSMVDPREHPKEAEAAGIQTPTELVVEYRRRTEHLALGQFNEQTFANLLMRLARGTESVVLWLDGHGERKLNGTANHDLGDFGRELERRGFRLNSLNLAVAQDVPANAAALVIASPQVDLLPAEVEKIMHYVARGGNLLWLIDPEPLHGLQPLAEKLRLVLTPGTVVDFVVHPRAGPPVFAVGTAGGYGRHAITDGFGLNTLFPYSRAIGSIESEEWHVTPLVDVAQRGWVETASLDPSKVAFDKSRDIPGPVTVAEALDRTVGDRQQRVVVVGTGQFLSNAFLGNGGNLDLGLNIMNWVTGSEQMLSIQPRPTPDARLDIDQTKLYLIAFVFLILLPALFMVAGMIVWWRRRRAL